jgi:hypothetical protein
MTCGRTPELFLKRLVNEEFAEKRFLESGKAMMPGMVWNIRG